MPTQWSEAEQVPLGYIRPNGYTPTIGRRCVGTGFYPARDIPKTKPILTDGVSFCDYPQVLLFAPSHIARKGECEGGTFDGFPHSRSITRPQATDFAQQNRRSKKIRPPKGWSYFFGAGDEARTRFPASREWQSHSQEPCLTSEFDALRAGRGSEFKPARGIPKRKHHPDGWCFFL